MKGKKGVIGWIVGTILLIILIVVGYIGITIYQGYGVVKTVTGEVPLIEQDLEGLKQGDCDKIDSIELRVDRIKDKLDTACANLLIRKFVEKAEGLIANCDDKEKVYSEFVSTMSEYSGSCEIIQDFLEENNVTIEDLESLNNDSV